MSASAGGKRKSSAATSAAAAPAAAAVAATTGSNGGGPCSSQSPPLQKKTRADPGAASAPNDTHAGGIAAAEHAQFAWLRGATVDDDDVDDDDDGHGDGGWRRMTFDLRPGEGVMLTGRFDVAVVRGELTVHGYTLRPPAAAAAATAAAADVEGAVPDVAAPAHFDVAAWEPVPVFHAGLLGARVCVTGRLVRSTAGRRGGRTSAAGGDGGASFAVIAPGRPAAAAAAAPSPPSPAVTFVYPAAWVAFAEELLRCPARHVRVVLCGAKNSGKSTFAKYLANRFLSAAAGVGGDGCAGVGAGVAAAVAAASASGGDAVRQGLQEQQQQPRRSRRRQVYFLNADAGQTELTPAGMVATHRLHPGQPLQAGTVANVRLCAGDPVAAYFIGSANPEQQPPLYIESLRALCACTADAAEVMGVDASGPSVTIINTAGWVQGLGLRYLGCLLQFARPTHVVQLSSNAPLDAEVGRWAHQAQGGSGGYGGGVSGSGGGDAAVGCVVAKLPPRPDHSGGADRRQRTGGGGGGGSGGGVAAPSPAQLRTLVLVHYFSDAAVRCARAAGREAPGGSAAREASPWTARNFDPTATDGALAQTLARMPPVQVSFPDVALQVLHAGSLRRADYLAAMNGSIVGLCALPTAARPDAFGLHWAPARDGYGALVGGAAGHGRGSGLGGVGTSGGGSSNPEGLPHFLDADGGGGGPQPVYRCVGLGIVRAVDPDTKKIYVLTPLPLEVLEGDPDDSDGSGSGSSGVRVLVKGDLDVPTGMASRGEASGLEEPFLVRQSLRATDAGATAQRSRNHLKKHHHRAPAHQRHSSTR